MNIDHEKIMQGLREPTWKTSAEPEKQMAKVKRPQVIKLLGSGFYCRQEADEYFDSLEAQLTSSKAEVERLREDLKGRDQFIIDTLKEKE